LRKYFISKSTNSFQNSTEFLNFIYNNLLANKFLLVGIYIIFFCNCFNSPSLKQHYQFSCLYYCNIYKFKKNCLVKLSKNETNEHQRYKKFIEKRFQGYLPLDDMLGIGI
jgi:hypothetical protein